MSGVTILSGKENMDVKAIHQFLSEESYWAKGISFEFVDQSLTNSFCAGAFIDGKQVGFGRVINPMKNKDSSTRYMGIPG